MQQMQVPTLTLHKSFPLSVLVYLDKRVNTSADGLFLYVCVVPSTMGQVKVAACP